MNLAEINLQDFEYNSMLYQAQQYIKKYNKKFWFGDHSFSMPKYSDIANNNSVWLDLYPLATISDNTQSVIDIYTNPILLNILAKIGIKVIHTNPLQLAGSINRDLTNNKSIDGGYDRINYNIDYLFGNNKEYKKFVSHAKEQGILIAGDIIPGHTGMGADFVLALANYKQYPNLFIMREINKENWELLPEVESKDNFINTQNLTNLEVEQLIAKDYIPGTMSLVMFKEKGVKETNWSVTEEIIGHDGIARRWIYLHWFKSGQPSLNWLDPSFSAQQLIAGDIVQHILELGTKILRLDANCLLGLEKLDNTMELLGSGHPLSSLSTKQLAMQIRKLGAYSYEENNPELDQIKSVENQGPDLSYDFPLRTGYIHAIATGDASLLKLQQGLVKEHNINTQRLIHALQNHDNLCYELPHFDKYPDNIYKFKNKNLSAKNIQDFILKQAEEFCKANKLPFKLSFGGIQAHFVELIAARLNIDYKRLLDKKLLSNTEYVSIERLMLLAVFYNAMQPGIFQLSAWDLLGSVHKDSELLEECLKDGDTRWLCRSGFDLLGDFDHKISKTKNNIPKNNIPSCYPLFGNLSDQINDTNSFVNKISNLLQIRQKTEIAICEFKDIIDSDFDAINICLYYHQQKNIYYIVVCNFADRSINMYDSMNNIGIFNNNNFYEHINKININNNSKNYKEYFIVPGCSGRIFEIK